MVERVEEHWAVLKSHLLADGGYDRLVDFLGDAHNMALIERANSGRSLIRPQRASKRPDRFIRESRKARQLRVIDQAPFRRRKLNFL